MLSPWGYLQAACKAFVFKLASFAAAKPVKCFKMSMVGLDLIAAPLSCFCNLWQSLRANDKFNLAGDQRLDPDYFGGVSVEAHTGGEAKSHVCLCCRRQEERASQVQH